MGLRRHMWYTYTDLVLLNLVANKLYISNFRSLLHTHGLEEAHVVHLLGPGQLGLVWEVG